MSEHFFGLGRGHLSAKAGKIARQHGAHLVNYTDPGCGCGYGCRGGCSANRRHWFACENRGAPFDDWTASAVMAAIDRAGGIEALRKR